MREQEVRELYEAYLQVYQPQEEVEQLDEARTDPRGRPASGPMSVYGGRGTPSPDPEGDDNVSRMDLAQRRVKRTQPRAKGMAADALFTKYSARQSGSSAGGEEGPGPKAPRRGGRSGRGANTDRGSGNAAKRRMSEDFDLFDTILEHLVAEGYADTNESALVIMANMSEEWRQSILDESLLDVARGVGKVAGNVAKDVKDRVTGKKELIGGPQGYVKVGGPSKPGDVKVSGIGPVGTYGKRTTPTGTNSPAATMSMRAR